MLKLQCSNEIIMFRASVNTTLSTKYSYYLLCRGGYFLCFGLFALFALVWFGLPVCLLPTVLKTINEQAIINSLNYNIRFYINHIAKL